MKVTSVLKSSLAALMVASIAAGYAWADKDDRGGGRGGGGGDRGGGSSRSFSGGGGERSSRSFSGGGERSSRSFSRGDGSSRSISGDGERSSRSFSDGSRSFRSSDSGSRSFSGQSGSPSYEGMRSSRGSGEGSSQFRTFRSSQPDGDGSTSARSRSEYFRAGPNADRSGESRSVVRDRSPDGQRGTFDQGRQQYQARRPSEEQVRDFLQMRGDRSERQVGEARDRSEFRDGRSIRGDSDQRSREDIARRLDEGSRDRDFSDRNRDRDFADRNRGERDGNRDYQRWREGAWDRDRDDDNRDWSGRWRDGDRFTSARRIRDSWRDRDWDDDDFPFYGQWWGRRDHWHGDDDWDWWGGYAHRHNHPWYWWTWTTGPRLGSWISFGWPRPYYWDYGYGEYIYYDDGAFYVNGRWYQPGPVFYDRTVAIVEQAPELTPEEAAQLEWLPLGVFAVARDGSPEADVLVQLAVTKDGVMGGTASDQRSGAAYPIQGMVDKQTQRAVWSYTNDRNRRIVMETSIYNLTQPEATGLVHYGPDQSEVVELVRLEEPSAATTTGELPAP